MGDWQPIETAPKDGSLVMLVLETGVVIPGWWDEDCCRWSNNMQPGWYAYIHNWGMGLTRLRLATHWMPLPPPPGDSKP